MPSTLPSLNALRAFESAARLESMTRAAQELHVTHGAVSRQIRALEVTLGASLFIRQGRGVGLTPAGRQLLQGTRAAFDQLRDTCAAVHRVAAQAPFVLACPGSLLARWMIPRLERLNRELEPLELHLAALEDEHQHLDDSRIHAALLLAEPPGPSGWQSHQLAAERIGPVLSPRYRGYSRLLRQPASALLGEALLHTVSRPQAWPIWASMQHLEPVQLRYGSSFEHLYYMLEAAVAGLGVAIAPEQLVADELASGQLAAPWGFQATRANWMLCLPTRHPDDRSRRLLGWLQRELGQAAHATKSSDEHSA